MVGSGKGRHKGPLSHQVSPVHHLLQSHPCQTLGVPGDELVGDVHGGGVDGEPVDLGPNSIEKKLA